MLAEETQYLSGKKDGPVTTWQKSGVKEMEGGYKANLKNGAFNYYDEDGALTKVEEYKAGKLLHTKRLPVPKKSAKVAKRE